MKVEEEWPYSSLHPFTEKVEAFYEFGDPRLNDTFLSGGIDLLRTERQFLDFDRSTADGALSLGYPLEFVFGESAQDIIFSTRYELMDVEAATLESAASLVAASMRAKATKEGLSKQERVPVDKACNYLLKLRKYLNYEYYIAQGMPIGTGVIEERAGT